VSESLRAIFAEHRRETAELLAEHRDQVRELMGEAGLLAEWIPIDRASGIACVSTWTIRRWCRAGHVPYMKEGEVLRIYRRGFLDFLRERTGKEAS